MQVSTVFMRDGVIYIQFSDLVESIEKLKLDQDTKDALSLYLDTIEVIDNEWWQISIPDIIDSLELESMQSNSIKEVYSCVVEAMDSDISGEMARFYGANKFCKLNKSIRMPFRTIKDHLGIIISIKYLSINKNMPTSLIEFQKLIPYRISSIVITT